MLLNLIFAAVPAMVAPAQAVAPEQLGNDPRLNIDGTMGLWSVPTSQLTDDQRAQLVGVGCQVLDYNTAVGGEWQAKVAPPWVDPVEV